MHNNGSIVEVFARNISEMPSEIIVVADNNHDLPRESEMPYRDTIQESDESREIVKRSSLLPDVETLRKLEEL